VNGIRPNNHTARRAADFVPLSLGFGCARDRPTDPANAQTSAEAPDAKVVKIMAAL
jgi:hypothetical protein